MKHEDFEAKTLMAMLPDVELSMQTEQLWFELQKHLYIESDLVIYPNHAGLFISLNDDYILEMTPAAIGAASFPLWFFKRVLKSTRESSFEIRFELIANVRLIDTKASQDSDKQVCVFSHRGIDLQSFIRSALSQIKANSGLRLAPKPILKVKGE
jgi:hypothetical protein